MKTAQASPVDGEKCPRKWSTRNLARIGVLAALATILIITLEFPLLMAYPFLKYDASDVPELLGAFSLGPVAGMLIALVKCILHYFTKGDWGILSNLVGAVVWVGLAGWIYRFHHSRLGAVAGLLLGGLGFILVMIVANLTVFLPMYGIPQEARWGMIWGGIVPFNIIKVLITSTLTFVLYTRVRNFLHDSRC